MISKRLQKNLKASNKRDLEKEIGRKDVGEGERGEEGEVDCGRVKFWARIRPDESTSAEAELKKEIRYICVFLTEWGRGEMVTHEF